MSFDANVAWQLHPRVALRPEPFGAMAYHYGNRRLNFLRAPELVELVGSIGDHPSARAAFEACGIDNSRWPSFEKALAGLAKSEFIITESSNPEVESAA